MHLPVLGRVDFPPCDRCNTTHDEDIVATFLHDRRCWGLTTALHNAWYRLNPFSVFSDRP